MNQWVILLEGISSDLMFYLALHLEEFSGVHDIQMHKLTTTQGWYNIITNKKWFTAVTETIQSNLQGWVDDIKSKHNIDLHGLPPATVKQKSTTKDQESKGGGSYLTACSFVFTFNEGSIDKPPDASGPVTQAWATPLSIPSTVESTTQDSISDITREDYDRVASDNAHLSHEVQELRQQMAHLLLQQQHNKPNSYSTSHHPSSTLQSPNNNLSQVFISQVAAAVAQIKNKTTQPSTKPNKWSATSITELPECGALMDESFDSTTMKS